jgi:hypothetical protein
VGARAELGAKVGERGVVEPWSETATAGQSELLTDQCSKAAPERRLETAGAWRSPAAVARAELGAKAGERAPETMVVGGWVGNRSTGQELGNYWGAIHSFLIA